MQEDQANVSLGNSYLQMKHA
jgi:hypothetical protein